VWDFDHGLNSEGFGIHYIRNSMRIPYSLCHNIVPNVDHHGCGENVTHGMMKDTEPYQKDE